MGLRIMKCPIEGCNYTSPTLFGIKLHLRYGHNARALKTCPICGREFRNPSSLRNHCSHMLDITHLALWWAMRGNRYGAKKWKIKKKELYEALREGKVKIPWPSIL